MHNSTMFSASRRTPRSAEAAVARLALAALPHEAPDVVVEKIASERVERPKGWDHRQRRCAISARFAQHRLVKQRHWLRDDRHS